MDFTTIVATLALTLGASYCAGINLYATVAVLGLMHRFANGFQLPGEMAVLGHPAVIGVALVLYTVEFVADKVPTVDTAWDAVHTFIRVPAGAVLAAMALGDVPLEWQVIAGLIGGTLAFGAHTTKATARVAAHGTGTSPVLSPVLSLAEDVAVVGTIALVTTHPLVALALLALLLTGSYLLLRLFWTVARKIFRSCFRRAEAPVELPPAAAA